jgi:hypothetical protein
MAAVTNAPRANTELMLAALGLDREFEVGPGPGWYAGWHCDWQLKHVSTAICPLPLPRPTPVVLPLSGAR